jgi:deoxycytidylate deaminase
MNRQLPERLIALTRKGKPLFDLISMVFREGKKEALVKSKCKRRPLFACLLPKETESKIELFFNGPNFHECQESKPIGSCGCVHSIQNLLVSYSFKIYGADYTLCCSYSPCTYCANLIVLLEPYISKVIIEDILPSDPRGMVILKKASIDVFQLRDRAVIQY